MDCKNRRIGTSIVLYLRKFTLIDAVGSTDSPCDIFEESRKNQPGPCIDESTDGGWLFIFDGDDGCDIVCAIIVADESVEIIEQFVRVLIG